MHNHENLRATLDAAARRAVDYWGTEVDEEDLILAGLSAAGAPVDRAEFRIMVEALIAIEDADSSRDLSGFGWSSHPSSDELDAFEQERRDEYDAALNRAVDDLADAEIVPFPVRALQAA